MAIDSRAEPLPIRPGAIDPNSTWASLSIPAYKRLFFGALMTFFAVQMQIVAASWLAFEITDSNAGVASIFFAMSVIMTLASPMGGVLSDRLPKRNLIVGAQIAIIAVGIALGTMVATDIINMPLLLGTFALQAFAFSILVPARFAFTSSVVSSDLLPNAIVLGSMSDSGTRVFSPALAGGLISLSWFGAKGVFFLAAGVTVLGALIMMRLPDGAPTTAIEDRRGPLQEMKDGIRYAREHDEIRRLIMVASIIVLAAMPMGTFYPGIADDLDVGSGGYGMMSGAGGAGAVIVALLIAKRSAGPVAWRFLQIAAAAMAVGLVVMASANTLVLAVGTAFVLGAAQSGFQSMSSSLVLNMAHIEYHGRVQSLLLLSLGGFGLVAAPLALLADHVGRTPVMTGMGIVTGAAIATFAVDRLRRSRAAVVLP